MIIVVERPFSDFTEFSATKGNITFSSGDVKIYVFENEEKFREKFPDSPKEWDKLTNSIYWEKKDEDFG